MKKNLLIAAALLTMALPAAAQMSNIAPAPGSVIDMDEMNFGLNSISFGLPDGSDANRASTLVTTLSRDGVVIAAVPASNSRQVQYDNLITGTWSLSFFLECNYECAKPGQYVISIPDGFFLIGKEQTPMEARTLTYTVPEPTLLVEPENHGKYTSLQDFTLTFPHAVSVKICDASKRLELFNIFGAGENIPDSADPDQGVTPSVGYFPEITFEGNKALLHYPRLVTAPGTWKIEAQAEAFTLTDKDGIAMDSPELNLFFVIPNLAEMPTIDPGEGPITDFPGEIYIDMPEGKEVDLVNDMAVNYIYPVKADGSYGKYIARYKAKYVPGGQPVTRVILENIFGKDKDVVPAPGEYVLVTAEQLYRVKGMQKFISSMTFHYTVVPTDKVKMDIEPASGTAHSELKSVKVSFPEAESVEVVNTGFSSWIKSPICNYQCWPAKVEGEPKTIEFRMASPVTYPGDYRLSSEAGTVVVDGVQVTVVADYTIGTTGVGCLKDVNVLPGRSDIFAIDGRVIARQADAERLNALPAGIYICAGKKIMIRK